MNPKQRSPRRKRCEAQTTPLTPHQTARATLLLREMVLDGHFLPGERIKEIPLAATLGVSRIPLRLALERLAHEGLL